MCISPWNVEETRQEYGREDIVGYEQLVTSLGQPVLVGVRKAHSLMPLYAQTGGEEDAGSQGHVTDTLASMVQMGGVEVVVHHYGAQGKVCMSYSAEHSWKVKSEDPVWFI